MSLIVSVLSVSERKNHAEGNIYQDKREAVLYRGQLWSATYDSNREVTNIFIPYTVKLGGWFSGLGKYKAPPRLTNFPSPLDLSRGVGGAGGSSSTRNLLIPCVSNAWNEVQISKTFSKRHGIFGIFYLRICHRKDERNDLVLLSSNWFELYFLLSNTSTNDNPFKLFLVSYCCYFNRDKRLSFQ